MYLYFLIWVSLSHSLLIVLLFLIIVGVRDSAKFESGACGGRFEMRLPRARLPEVDL
jgi:hypothetical protein